MTGRTVERPAPAEDIYAAAERRRAARALLRYPLLHGEGGEAEVFRLVRRHRAELAKMFADGLAYRLVVDPTAARLYKPGLGRDATRPLRKKSGAPFTPRGYALLCLTVAALTTSRQQLLVDELVATVRSAAVDAGVDVDLDQIADRRALYAALQVLIELGVLRERDGDLQRWTADGRTPALLDVRRDRLGLLASAPLASCNSAADLLETASLPSAAGGARVAIRRRLVESPVLSTSDLVDEHAEWWRRNRNRERDWFRDRLGLEVELRAEGAIAIDPDDELTDVDFPAGGSVKHFALLLLEALVEQVRCRARTAEALDRTWVAVTAAELDAAAEAVFGRWSAGLRRDHRADPTRARAEALDVLRAVGLVERVGDGARLHAAAARYVPRPTLAEPAPSGEPSLFAGVEEP